MLALFATLGLVQATAAPVQTPAPSSPAPAGDGRLLGHYPYGDAAPADLVPAPPGFGLHDCRIRREVYADLVRLLAAAAADPATRGTIRGLSCHRSIRLKKALRSSLAPRPGRCVPAGYGDGCTTIRWPSRSERCS